MSPKNEIVAMDLYYNQGWTITAISKHLRAGRYTVSKLIRDTREEDCTREPELDHSTDLLDYMQSGIEQ